MKFKSSLNTHVILKAIAYIILILIAACSVGKIIEYHNDAIDSTIDIPDKPIESMDPIESIQPSIIEPIEFLEPNDTTRVDIDLDNSEPAMIPEYVDLYTENSDMVGRILIQDTNIDYPIMYSEESNYYLRRDFSKSSNSHGCIFLGNNMTIDDNAIVIYGHNMKDKTMFSALTKFLDEEFFNIHQYIQLDSLYEERNYQVIAVARDYVHSVSDESFKFYNYYGTPTEEEFNEFKEFLMTHSVHTRDIEFLTYDDKIAQLVTCSYHRDHGRLIIICKEVTDAN